MAKKFLPPCLALAAVWACGCGPARPQIPVGSVEKVDLMVAPTPLNWDHVPGPDGLRANVLLYHVTRQKVLAVRADGKLEFLLFEGPVRRKEIGSAEPFHVWPFTPQQLSSYMYRDRAGFGYRLRLPWGNKIPRSGSITLAARYTPIKGRTLYSEPAVIAMRTK